jgi:beta-glucosidase
VKDLPDFEDYAMTNRTYRYFTGEPLYPFGYGLSYTSFSVRDAKAGEGTVSMEISNTGDRDGETVLQVYVACDSPFAPAHPRLCGFRRVALKSGETKSFEVTLDPYTDTVIDEAGERRKAEHYTLYAGLGQPDDLSIRLTGIRPVEIKK